MAARLAVIPAGSVSSAEQAGQLVTAMRTAPRGRPQAAIVEALGALRSSGVGTFTVGQRTDSRGALLSVRYPEIGVLEALLLLARYHGLAVYDIALNRLYDPTGSLDVEVVQPGIRLPFLTRALLVDLVLRPAWPVPEAPFVTVDRAEEDFIQFWCRGGDYQLEYREGGREFHFSHITDDPHLVIDVVWAWGVGHPYWRGAVPWELAELEEPAPADPDPLSLSWWP